VCAGASTMCIVPNETEKNRVRRRGHRIAVRKALNALLRYTQATTCLISRYCAKVFAPRTPSVFAPPAVYYLLGVKSYTR